MLAHGEATPARRPRGPVHGRTVARLYLLTRPPGAVRARLRYLCRPRAVTTWPKPVALPRCGTSPSSRATELFDLHRVGITEARRWPIGPARWPRRDLPRATRRRRAGPATRAISVNITARWRTSRRSSAFARRRPRVLRAARHPPLHRFTDFPLRRRVPPHTSHSAFDRGHPNRRADGRTRNHQNNLPEGGSAYDLIPLLSDG